MSFVIVLSCTVWHAPARHPAPHYPNRQQLYWPHYPKPLWLSLSVWKTWNRTRQRVLGLQLWAKGLKPRNKLTCALPAYAGQLTVDVNNRINVISRKAIHRRLTGYCVWHRRCYWQVRSQNLSAGQWITQPGHSLHHVLHPKTCTYSSYKLRKRQHPWSDANCSIFAV